MTLNTAWARRILGLALASSLSSLSMAGQAAAMTPATVNVDGILTGATGAAAPDGAYAMSFAVYGQLAGGAPAWKEGPLTVTVSGGRFSLALGAQTPLTGATLASLNAAWLGVTVGADPELPRKQLHAAPFALRTGVAESLDCSGCVKLGHLEPGLLAKVASTGSYKDLADLPKYADVASSGQYGDLGGLPVLAKLGTACGSGLVVRGLKADGSLDCISAAITAASLPKDGLDEVSNGLLTAQFTELASSTNTPIDIADNLPAGVSDGITVPDFGTADGLVVSLDITNSDISKLRVTLYDPAGAPYKLYDQGGAGTALKGTWPSPSALVSGDLGSWVGKNPKGTWSLNVADLAGVANAKDGKLVSWSIGVKTLSTKKVASSGVFLASGGLQLQVATQHPVPCTADKFGYIYANSSDSNMYVCNGKQFFPIALMPYGSQSLPGKSCKDILAKAPSSGSGTYWLSVGNETFQTYCDMTNNGGGWTLAARMVGGSWCHIDANSSGGLTSPNQAGCAKLSDEAIRTLYSDQFWLSCGTASPSRWGKIDAIAKWNTTSAKGDKTMTWSASYGGATYSGTDDTCCNFGDYNYHTPAIIYSISTGYNGGNYKADWSGCYNSLEGWNRPGFLFVR